MTSSRCGKTVVRAGARIAGVRMAGGEVETKRHLSSPPPSYRVRESRRKPPSRAVSAQYDRQTGGWRTTMAAADAERQRDRRRRAEHEWCPKKRDANLASGRRYRRKTVAGVWAERALRRASGRAGGRTTDLRETRRGDERCHGVAAARGAARGSEKKSHDGIRGRRPDGCAQMLPMSHGCGSDGVRARVVSPPPPPLQSFSSARLVIIIIFSGRSTKYYTIIIIITIWP